MSSQTKPTSLLSRHRLLAPIASARVSPLCLGTMTFGEKQADRYGECSKETTFSILDTFYGQGGNFIDTANVYHYGESEQWVGEWMASRKNRDEIFLATKYSSSSATGEAQIQSNFAGNGIKSMRLSIEKSLKNLQTNYIDLFYLHWWDAATTIPEIMHALNDLVSSGKVNYLGISDTPAWIVSKANQYARDHGLRPFVVYQGMWNAALRDFERDIIPMCKDEGMALCPYGVLNQGRFQTEEGFKAREQNNPGRNFVPLSDLDKRVSKVLETISNTRSTGLTNVALAYVRQKAPYVFPIVGARKVSHIEGTLEGLHVNLSQKEVEAIEAAYPFDYGFPQTFLSGSLIFGGESRGINGPGDVFLIKGSGTFDYIEEAKPINLTEQV